MRSILIIGALRRVGARAGAARKRCLAPGEEVPGEEVPGTLLS